MVSLVTRVLCTSQIADEVRRALVAGILRPEDVGALP
jgi:hypothetical protein